MPSPEEAWDQWAVELMRAGADLDLRTDGEAIPRFVALEGDRALMIAHVRPFPKGGYHEPLIELMALAVPLGADRVAVGITGRVWSLVDPIVPVLDGVGDLRQRALVVELVDGHQRAATARTVVVPFSLDADGPAWEEPFDPGPGEGWIPAALPVLVDGRGTFEATPADLREQAERCLALGHGLVLVDEIADRLGVEPTGSR